MRIVFLIPGEDICCVKPIVSCSPTLHLWGAWVYLLSDLWGRLLLCSPQSCPFFSLNMAISLSFSSLEVCSSLQSSWWPFTEFIPGSQWVSCTGGPKTGLSICIWLVIPFYSVFISFAPSIASKFLLIQVAVDFLCCQVTDTCFCPACRKWPDSVLSSESKCYSV